MYSNTSSVAFDLLLRHGNLSVIGTYVVDPRDGDTENARASISWHGPRGAIVNVGYQQFEPIIEQTDLSVYLPLTSRWSVFGRWNFDVRRADQIEWFAGLQYDDCCWRIRVLNRHFVRTPGISRIVNEETGIFFQVILKGVTGVGENVDNLISNSIRGYYDDQRFY